MENFSRFYLNWILMVGVLLGINVSTSSPAVASDVLRQIDMNHDPSIRNVVYRALNSAAGKIQNITRGSDQSVALQVHENELKCTGEACTLTWNPNATRDVAGFSTSLFDALESLATSDAKFDPLLQRAVYPQTGSVMLTVRESNMSADKILCVWIKSSAQSYKDCTLVLSASQVGNQAELKVAYDELLNGKTGMSEVRDALIASVSTNEFRTAEAGQPDPCLYSVTRTLYSNLLIEALNVQVNFPYKVAKKSPNGQILADGISLELKGQRYQGGEIRLQEISAHAYVLARRPK